MKEPKVVRKSLGMMLDSYNACDDRSRILEGYSLYGIQSRFLYNGLTCRCEGNISSPETCLDDAPQVQEDVTSRSMKSNEKSYVVSVLTPQLEAVDVGAEEADLSTKQWEDLTSSNSLADVSQ
ncbi:hypothetical protein AZE42_06093 [Rhizopogon vesiculosus]|uniref:Uncharacterized protein n=1 Tax=Rhizopogon vesiculosus TaxID=180088 RepID=A0A1J8QH66_9AGAM|nr:hypothetical protein AZE42_06093 [Rhizopogon vesiculosus]